MHVHSMIAFIKNIFKDLETNPLKDLQKLKKFPVDPVEIFFLFYISH